MASLRYVIYDLHKTLEQTYVDAEININHVLYWVLVHADRLKSQHIPKHDTGRFKTTFYDVPVLKDAHNRKYFELPNSIYDFEGDRGIVYVGYHWTFDDCRPPINWITFSRTKPEILKIHYWSEEETPTPKNPYFYRVSDQVFLVGVEAIDIQNIELCLMTTFDPQTLGDLDAEFDFPEELIPILQKQVLDMGRFALMIPAERLNDGTASNNQGQAIAKQKPQPQEQEQ